MSVRIKATAKSCRLEPMSNGTPSGSGLNQRYVPGIIGGMGSFAGVLFQLRLIECRKALGVSRDQDHPEWLFVNAASVPDRRAPSAGSNCIAKLIQFGRKLEQSGCDFIVVPCNRAHVHWSEVQRELGVPWLHMPRLVSAELKLAVPSIRRVAVLATTGTLLSGLYPAVLNASGIAAISPSIGSEIQAGIMEAVYDPDFGIKATGTSISKQVVVRLKAAVGWCQQMEAEAVLVGCTDLSAATTHLGTTALPIIDALEILARSTIDVTYGRMSMHQS